MFRKFLSIIRFYLFVQELDNLIADHEIHSKRNVFEIRNVTSCSAFIRVMYDSRTNKNVNARYIIFQSMKKSIKPNK